ncbi:bifunctional metallophosphatase/5'-nucleotidase [Murdochiella sp. Marseille-P8839]|nr:bifunctional metallophosphatase/5'-nucleotidase [Murdochiella sp. Marseille-P8839]
MQKKRFGFVLAMLLSAVLFLPNTALADNPEAKGTFFVDDVVEQVMEEEQTEQEKVDVVKEATETEEKEAVLTKEDVAGKTLTILHTNDVHGHVENSSKDGKKGNIGYANYAGIIEAKKAEGPTLVVDGGDLTQGTNFVTLSKGESIINLANKIGVQAMVPGNHEFDYSQEQAKKNASLANFPWFASNVFDKDGNLLFHGGEVLDVQGIKVGVFGLATPETKYKANPLNTEGLTFTDTVDETVRIAQREIDKLLSRGANYTILLSHLGSDEESEVNTLKVVPKLKNLDLVVDGHSHTEWQNGHVFENGTVGASTGEYLKNVGIVQVTFDEEGKAETKAELINYEQAKTYPVNKEVEDVIAEFDKENEKVLGQEVGTLAATLDGEREHVRAGETALGDLITDAMRKESGADVVITNGGGIRASIAAGKVTVGHVFTVLPFGNAMTVIEVSGQDIIDAINYGISEYPNPAGKFPHISGMRFEITKKDGKAAAANIMVGNAPIEPTKTYKLATNDFMAVGGDGYEMFKGKTLLATHGSLAQVVQDYMTELTKYGKGTFTYATDGRVKEAKAEEKPTPKPNENKPATEKPSTKVAGTNKVAPKTGDVMTLAPMVLLLSGMALTMTKKKETK